MDRLANYLAEEELLTKAIPTTGQKALTAIFGLFGESVQKKSLPCARTKTDVQGVIRLQIGFCNSPRRYGGNMYQIGRSLGVCVSPAPSHVSRDGRRDPRHRRRRIKPVSSGHPLETENFCRPLDLALNVLKLDHTAN
jgi:hypothetical protein